MTDENGLGYPLLRHHGDSVSPQQRRLAVLAGRHRLTNTDRVMTSSMLGRDLPQPGPRDAVYSLDPYGGVNICVKRKEENCTSHVNDSEGERLQQEIKVILNKTDIKAP